jgi:hypothetical protein
MRRTVYLDTVAEVVKAQMFLGGLAGEDVTKLDIGKGLEGLNTAIARVAVVGEQATAAKARDLQLAFTKILFKHLADLRPVHALKLSAIVHRNLYNDARAEINRVLAAMTNFNETAQKDRARFDALQQSFKFYQSQTDQEDAACNAAEAEALRLQTAHGLTLFNETKAMVTLLDDLLCTVRAELGIVTDAAKFRQQTEVLYQEVGAAMRDILSKFSKDISKSDDEAQDGVTFEGSSSPEKAQAL